uniref:RNase H type-1 domain-containing protein n=1 Tax=Nelumbo nucifera TaxID=4432 RepID=A0A822ZS36_NELNU|nr:TPA_asm: hypothetical protein HUJ06_017634 [Nelumbo nucifera]
MVWFSLDFTFDQYFKKQALSSVGSIVEEAELMAIYRALLKVKQAGRRHLLICLDSQSILQALQSSCSNLPWQFLHLSSSIKFI